MTITAKMYVTAVREFGAADLVKLQCVYETDGLNANGKGWEDRRFTTATPWGEADLTTPHNGFYAPEPGQHYGTMVYLVFVPVAELDDYVVRPECLAAMRVKAKRPADMGYTTQVEIALDKKHHEGTPGLAISCKMAIDAERASAAFSDGAEFFLVIYDAAKTTLAEAANGASPADA